MDELTNTIKQLMNDLTQNSENLQNEYEFTLQRGQEQKKAHLCYVYVSYGGFTE